MQAHHWVMLLIVLVGAYYIGRNHPLGLPYLG
jgi:hypothetical protein